MYGGGGGRYVPSDFSVHVDKNQTKSWCIILRFWLVPNSKSTIYGINMARSCNYLGSHACTAIEGWGGGGGGGGGGEHWQRSTEARSGRKTAAGCWYFARSVETFLPRHDFRLSGSPLVARYSISAYFELTD